MKRIVKRALARTPYRLVRRTRLNRFQAVDETLASLAERGYRPDAVIDAGAYTGGFAQSALRTFPGTFVHAFEPQPGCQRALTSLRASSAGRLEIYPVALCGPENDGGSLLLSTAIEASSTGAHVVDEGKGSAVPCQTLDTALGKHLASLAGGLLKLDLQGYELHALRGASAVLRQTNVILTEVSFYAQAYEPKISALIAYLAERGFELHDIASIYARPRDDRPRQGDFIFVREGSALAMDTAWS